MLRQSGRSPFTLVVLVLASLTAITLDFRGGDVIPAVRGAATDVLAPVRDAGEAVFAPVGDALSGVTGYGALEEENERLRARLEELEGERLAGEDGRAELEALLVASGLTSFTQLPAVAARVVGAPAANFERTIQLDRGSDHGVAPDMPVVTGAGLVGRVVEVSRTRAAVLLVTDPSSAVGVRLSASGDLGVAEGAGAGRTLALGLVDPGSPPARGDLVVTSGVDGSVFPGGIPFGRVTRVERPPGDLEVEVDVAPVADLDRLRFVSVLRTGGPVILTARLPPVLVAVVMVHTAVVPHLRVSGVSADLLLLAGVAAGIAAGPDRGAVVGFAAGLLADCFVTTPFGLSALSGTAVGYGVGAFSRWVTRAGPGIPAITAAVASAAGTVVFAVVGTVLGEPQLLTGRLLAVALVVGVTNGLFLPVVLWPVRWATGAGAVPGLVAR